MRIDGISNSAGDIRWDPQVGATSRSEHSLPGGEAGMTISPAAETIRQLEEGLAQIPRVRTDKVATLRRELSEGLQVDLRELAARIVEALGADALIDQSLPPAA